MSLFKIESELGDIDSILGGKVSELIETETTNILSLAEEMEGRITELEGEAEDKQQELDNLQEKFENMECELREIHEIKGLENYE